MWFVICQTSPQIVPQYSKPLLYHRACLGHSPLYNTQYDHHETSSQPPFWCSPCNTDSSEEVLNPIKVSANEEFADGDDVNFRHTLRSNRSPWSNQNRFLRLTSCNLWYVSTLSVSYSYVHCTSSCWNEIFSSCRLQYRFNRDILIISSANVVTNEDFTDGDVDNLRFTLKSSDSPWPNQTRPYV